MSGALPVWMLALAGCAESPTQAPVSGLSPARGAPLQACAEIASKLVFPRTVIASAESVPAGKLAVAGSPVAEHCLVVGRMNERTSAVDGQTYSIGFQMRLPRDWNGRFLHQGNGGLDGFVTDALGLASGGGPLTSALQQGFAVLSSDAGHSRQQLPRFGLDPQARLDYGYQAAATLTPMARQLIAVAYGKTPDRSYFAGCSNGGRHAMVAAVRLADQYDGILAGNPGFNLPKAALAQLYGAQQFATVATTPDLASAVTPAERKLVAERVLARCDALDGATDGLVQDSAACQKAFDLQRDVPTCSGARDGSCLSAAQKGVLSRIFSGPTLPGGAKLYASFPYDPGIAGADWASWKFVSSITNRDPVAVAYVFQTPPTTVDVTKDPRAFAMNFDIAGNAGTVFATSGPFTESAMGFMAPPASDLGTLKRRGGKMMVYHGMSDGVFSPDDTVAWYEGLRKAHAGHAADFARLYLVPGMNHCRGGPSTDQFDMLPALVAWVEQGRAPDRVVAQARGAGNAVPNPELPSAWAADRSRPLCPYPLVARYKGAGDIDRAEHFECR
jgi:pimeloyl-ACP methyl ester carboxylesterase